MIRKKIRVSVRLERDADKAAVLAAMEAELGCPPEIIWDFRDMPLLTLRLLPGDLGRVRRIPGVLSAVEEERIPLPGKPSPPTASE